MPPSHAKRPIRAKRVTIILLVAAIGFLVISVIAVISNALKNAFAGFSADDSVQLLALPAGIDAGKFDPVASYGPIHFVAGMESELIVITALGVRSDGTIDLNADYSTKVEYDFGQKLPPPLTRQPLGAGGIADDQYYMPIYLLVFGKGQHKNIVQGIQRISTPGYYSVPPRLVQAPVCSFAKLWGMAVTKGVPQSAVAKIVYTGSRYNFSIEATPIRLNFDETCQLVDAHVPTSQPTLSAQ